MSSSMMLNKDYIMSSDSSDNLKIHKKGYRSIKGGNYQIMRYDKDFLCKDDIENGKFRSVIVNLTSKEPIIFSPTKSLNLSDLKDSDMEYIRAEEFAEGTMVNLFYDKSISSWDIATRSTVGGNVKFYRDAPKTFAVLFKEACDVCEMNIEDNLNENYCYSFVLQHPENRIVSPFKQPNLVLISAYSFENVEIDNVDMIRVSGYDFNNINTLNDDMKKVKTYICDFTKVKVPQIYNDDMNHTKEYYINTYASQNTEYDIVGVVFKDNRNVFSRYKCRNPNYEEVRRMRGNQAKGQYTYLELRKSGKMSMYLKLYPEDKSKFADYRTQVHKFTHNLYNNYVRCYIKKEKALGEWPKQYRIHMYNIHQLYLNDYVSEKRSINLSVVIGYFNELHPSQQMALLNYNFRKNEKEAERIIIENKENIKEEEEEGSRL